MRRVSPSEGKAKLSPFPGALFSSIVSAVIASVHVESIAVQAEKSYAVPGPVIADDSGTCTHTNDPFVVIPCSDTENVKLLVSTVIPSPTKSSKTIFSLLKKSDT